MKALTITQPWASLLMAGEKRMETRGWRTDYRGPLAIHAAKGWTADDRWFAGEVCGRILNDGHTPDTLPRGAVLGIVHLLDCIRTDDMLHGVGPREAFLGDFSDGRFAWVVRIVEVYPEPIPARGALGLWDWETDTPVSGFGLVTTRDGSRARSKTWTCSCGLTRPMTGSYGCPDCNDARPDAEAVP